ncbi:Alpha/Beta hydrolase protein [Exophiala viscosa]|uniref:Kynurenine formamidase n=1 Tax=Exophiala viscosa TaxID=2486360 RepID=A0AAN6E7A7_9EURO|nr:Alpha/Beta hydrolase protein [Exophiala viscosa]
MTKPTSYSFGPYDLQEVLVWVPPEKSQDSLFWIVLIHGGAWRDPSITAQSFAEPAVSKLLSGAAPRLDIPQGKSLAFASISYRLSPHPDHPQDPVNTPSSSLRTARHPDHIDDVCSGLETLHRHHRLTVHNYILIGHSCGATLAFQALKRCTENAGLAVPPPSAVVGMAGIYHLQDLLDNHKQGPYADVYASFLKGAFGEDEVVWNEASPACWPDHHSDARMIYAGRTVLLVVADGDDLVEPQQRETMRVSILGGSKTSDSKDPLVQLDRKEDCNYSEMSVPGGHDEMWLNGERMISVIERVLQVLRTSDDTHS